MDIIRKLQEKGAELLSYKSSRKGNEPLDEIIKIKHDNTTWLIKSTRCEDGRGVFGVYYAANKKFVAEVYSIEDLVDLFN